MNLVLSMLGIGVLLSDKGGNLSSKSFLNDTQLFFITLAQFFLRIFQSVLKMVNLVDVIITLSSNELSNWRISSCYNLECIMKKPSDPKYLLTKIKF
jgi:hypothetical protein